MGEIIVPKEYTGKTKISFYLSMLVNFY